MGETEKDKGDAPAHEKTSETIEAVHALLADPEVHKMASLLLDRFATMSGKTPSGRRWGVFYNLGMMLSAFVCIGVFGHYKVITEGTAGALSGIVIGYFFKRTGD